MNASPERIGPYRIVRPIDKGGFGEVFEAVHEHMGKHVALKVLLPKHAQDPDTAARFIREARALAQFTNHPGIVQVHHFDRPEGGIAYLAMELLDGTTLRKWLRERNGPLPLESALMLGKQIAETMVDVHAKGFVHRDLKPENIMLVPDEAQPLGVRPKLLDFGIAKAPEPDLVDSRADTQIKTAGNQVMGTHVYMAPEQIKNADDIDAKADVYVLGIVVYELLAGQPPFQSDSDVELVWMHGRDIPKNLHDVVPTVPATLASFIASMLAKEPCERPSMRDCRDMFARDWLHEHLDCPLPGLQPFTDSQAHLFFGRRAETTSILAKLDEIRPGKMHRWLQIQGPSGTGKSSLVHAAIVPALVQSQEWRVITLRPAEDPIRSIAAALANAYAQSESKVLAAFRENSGALDAFILEHHRAETKLLLVVDQFEELFALGSAHLPAFEALLAQAFENADSPLRLLTTIRSDYLHRFDQALGLAKLLDHHALRYDLRPMDETALAEVIDGMSGRAGLRLSDGLPKKMVQDASGTDCRLPLLGHALRSLWPLRSGGEITHDHYDHLGGVGGALARHAEKLLDSLGKSGRERAKWLVLDLVQVGRGGPDTRRPRNRAEVLAAAGGGKAAEDILMHLSGVQAKGAETEPFRLVVLSGDAAEPVRQRVDLVHEMVLQKVPIVVGWINEERQSLEQLAALEGVANGWLGAKRPKSGLPLGSLLEHYRGGKDAERQMRLERMASENAREFLREATSFEQRQRRRSMAIRGVMLVAILAVVASALVANQERARSKDILYALLERATKARGSDWNLSRLGQTRQIRRDILAPWQQWLVEQEKIDRDGVRVVLIQVKHRLSDLERSSGTLQDSYALLTEAERRIDEGLKEDGSNDSLIELRALHHSKYGKLLLAEHEYSSAWDHFVKSIEWLETRGSEDQILATSYLELAEAEWRAGHPRDPEPWFKKGIELRKEIAARPNAEVYAHAMVADALTQWARVLLARGDRGDARNALEEARRIQTPITESEPHNLLYRSLSAQIEVVFAAVLREEQRPDDARKHYDGARQAAETLVAGDDQHKEYALLLIEALRGLEAIGDPQYRPEWAQRRCALIHQFVQKEQGRDRRFDPSTCPVSPR